MKKILIFLFVFFTCNIFADIPIDSFSVIEMKTKTVIKLGDPLSVFVKVFGKTIPVTKKYSNITLCEYRYKDVVFSTSSIPETSEIKSSILSIEIVTPLIKLVDGLKIGSTKKEVLKKYGTPEDIIKNTYYFYNHEWDLMELRITFDKNDKIESIRISMGT